MNSYTIEIHNSRICIRRSPDTMESCYGGGSVFNKHCL